MEILVKRLWKKDSYTGGKMFINGVEKYFTIEDCDRGLKKEMPLADIVKQKKYAITAIPTGKYQVALTYSNRFKKYMPQILDVPGYEGIRIHIANKASEIEGCIGIAMEDSSDGFAGKSGDAFKDFMSILSKAEKKEKIFITVE